jgi:hypothetical protein
LRCYFSLLDWEYGSVASICPGAQGTSPATQKCSDVGNYLVFLVEGHSFTFRLFLVFGVFLFA